MYSFSSDVDLARFEPGVFSDWYLASQVLCSGVNGVLSGCQFTASGVDFEASGVQAGGVIWLESGDGAIKGVYEIAEVIDAGHLGVSVIRTDPSQGLISVGTGSGLTWRILTYGVQGYEVLWELSQRLGISPGCPAAQHDVADIVNPETLRQVSVFGVLGAIFSALYRGDLDELVLLEKHDQYQWRYEQAMVRLNVKIDTDGDGDAERVLSPGMIRLVRA
jgi:hypothetical protein